MTIISVVMPVYNTKEEYLREAIESILNQTFGEFEFIIVNDGSTNNAEEVILSYKDERIRYIKQENQGIVSALNRGISSSCGAYIARMDSDDISYPERLEKQVEYLEKHPEISILGTGAGIIPTNSNIRIRTSIKIMDLLADNCLIHPTVMFRKADLDKYSLKYENDCPYAEDYNLWADSIKYLGITNLPDVLLDYRVYSNNSTTKNRDERVKSSFRVQDKLLKLMTDDERVQRRLIDIAYINKNKNKSFIEKIFSVKNLYKNWAKYKLLTFLGFEFLFKVKEFSR